MQRHGEPRYMYICMDVLHLHNHTYGSATPAELNSWGVTAEQEASIKYCVQLIR